MSPADAPSPARLRAVGLAVRRGERELFHDLDLEVTAGEVLLLRGPNGIGKSTLLLTLAGIVRADAGEVTIVPGEAALHLLTYQSGLKARLTVRENLDFWRTLYGDSGVAPEEALERVGLAELGGLETGYLSSGQARRLSLARLLVSHRPIWLLDEPTAALDAQGEHLLAELVDTHRRDGGAAVIATHHDLGLSAGVRTLRLGALP